MLSIHHAFVIHLRTASAEGRVLAGRAQHVVSGRTLTFESPEELLAFFANSMASEAETEGTEAAAEKKRDR